MVIFLRKISPKCFRLILKNHIVAQYCYKVKPQLSNSVDTFISIHYVLQIILKFKQKPNKKSCISFQNIQMLAYALLIIINYGVY